MSQLGKPIELPHESLQNASLWLGCQKIVPRTIPYSEAERAASMAAARNWLWGSSIAPPSEVDDSKNVIPTATDSANPVAVGAVSWDPIVTLSEVDWLQMLVPASAALFWPPPLLPIKPSLEIFPWLSAVLLLHWSTAWDCIHIPRLWGQWWLLGSHSLHWYPSMEQGIRQASK